MSKRFNFSVDIDDDSLFEKSVKDAITSYAKQQVRQSFQQEIQHEVERLVSIYKKDSYWDPYDRLIIDTIRRSLNEKLVNSYYNTNEFKEIIESHIKEILDNIPLKDMIIKEMGLKIFGILDNIINEMVDNKSNG